MIMLEQHRGSKRYWRSWRASERDRYKITNSHKTRSNRLMRRIPIDVDIPLGNYHKKLIHWRDIDKCW